MNESPKGGTAQVGPGVLSGLRVLSLSHVVAGPLAASMLADFGADVVHVEQPGVGDPARHLGFDRDGVYVWWKVAGRNKRSVTIDLRRAEGAALARDLAKWADVVISSIRPSTLKSWGLDYEAMRAANPKLVMLQITGFGMTGPKREEPGFGKVGEAMSGVVGITGHPDRPLHTAFSHGDATTGLMGAFAVMAALYRRHDPDFKGELIDLALYETLFRLIEWQVIAFDQLGFVANRAGNRLEFAPGAVANVYRSADGAWLTVTSATLRSVSNIVKLVGLPVDEFQTAADQRRRADEIDACLSEWISKHQAEDALSKMRNAGVVASKIYTVPDMVEDDVFRERENIVTVEDRDLGPIRMQGVVPRMTNRPGSIWRSGPQLGEDNEAVFKGILGMPEDRYQELRRSKVI